MNQSTETTELQRHRRIDVASLHEDDTSQYNHLVLMLERSEEWFDAQLSYDGAYNRWPRHIHRRKTSTQSTCNPMVFSSTIHHFEVHRRVLQLLAIRRSIVSVHIFPFEKRPETTQGKPYARNAPAAQREITHANKCCKTPCKLRDTERFRTLISPLQQPRYRLCTMRTRVRRS